MANRTRTRQTRYKNHYTEYYRLSNRKIVKNRRKFETNN